MAGEEKPTLETPKEETPKEEIKTDLDAGFMKALEQFGVGTPDELESRLKASKEVGQLANLLGQQRELNKQMASELQAAKARRPHDDFDLDNIGEGTTVNLEDVVSRSVEKVLSKRERTAQEYQQRLVSAWQKVTGDRNYAKVKDVWEEKLKDPQFVWQIQSGVVDPVDAYRGTVDDWKDGLLKQAFDTIKQLQGKQPGTPAPHVEGGGRTSANLVSEEPGEVPEHVKRYKELKEKVDKGVLLSDEEELELAGIAGLGIVQS